MRAPRTTVCFGASYTAGYWQGGRKFSPYASFLDLPAGDRAIEYGLPGETTGEMTKRIALVLADVPGAIHAVVLLGGTNDLANVHMPAAAILANLLCVVRAARARAMLVLWMTGVDDSVLRASLIAA